ncbi:MAG TPA: hypothetical protein VH370_19010 [Humisphaera sp.]|jgi:hypothetical protein|nr:hypothetical protein [Humisphaera sp.]
MNVNRIVTMRRLAAVFALAAMAWCSAAWAQVLDMVPADAAIVIKISNLQGTNTKIAKLAKDFGLDQIQPLFQDPLGALMEQAKVSKGVNKSGDLAIAILDPDANPPKFLAMVPVDDYKAFVSNFEAVGAETAGVSEVKTPDGPSLFLIHRGNYAVGSHDKETLSRQSGSLKFGPAISKDVSGKDAIVFINVPQVRTKALDAMHKNRQQAVDEALKNIGDDPNSKPFAGVAKVVMNQIFDLMERFLSDSTGVVFSVNFNDKGIALGGVSEFAADSKLGTTIAQFKNTGKPLIAGLPDRKYFAFGGMAVDPKAFGKVVSDCIDPINAELAKSGDTGKQIATLLESAKTLAGSISRVSAGYPMPTGALGTESIIQSVAVVEGNAKAAHDAEIKMLKGMGDLFALLPKEAGSIKFDLTPAAKTVDGVSLDTYMMNITTDPKDPQAAQMKSMMDMIYGPNGMGGTMGVVNDKTLVLVQGGSDKLVSDAVASAKSNADVLSSNSGVKMISGQLPKDRSLEYYVSLDNIVSAAAKYAAQFGVLPGNVKVPTDLPPLGFAAGTDGPAVRGEMFIPSQTVSSLISAGLQAYQQMQGGGNGKL